MMNHTNATATSRKMVEILRYGTFGPIVWDTDTHATRMATQDDLDTLPQGEDLTAEEEDEIED